MIVTRQVTTSVLHSEARTTVVGGTEFPCHFSSIESLLTEAAPAQASLRQGLRQVLIS